MAPRARTKTAVLPLALASAALWAVCTSAWWYSAAFAAGSPPQSSHPASRLLDFNVFNVERTAEPWAALDKVGLATSASSLVSGLGILAAGVATATMAASMARKQGQARVSRRSAVVSKGGSSDVESGGVEVLEKEGTVKAAQEDRKQDTKETEEKEAAAASKGGDNYWTQQWYPVLPVALLTGKGPEPVKLLGMDLVLWNDGDGSEASWRCTSGICPHRLAPLSKGRVTGDGTLMCRFHGWCFKGDGKCTKVPMAEGDKEAEDRLLGTPKTSLPTYPTKVRQGLVFVWPDANSAEKAEACEPFTCPDLTDPTWGLFDAHASWRVWMEQSWDPSHAPFLHQFTLPSFAPENARPMSPFKVEDLGDAGMSVEHGGYMQSNSGMEATRRFGAPCCNSTQYKYPDGRTVGFVFYFVPTEHGRCRHLTTSYFVPAPAGAEDKSKGGLANNQLQMSRVLLQGRTLQEVKERKSLGTRLKEVAVEKWPQLAQVERGLKNMRLLQGKLGDQDNAVLTFQDGVGLPAVRSGSYRGLLESERYGGPPSEYVLETHADALIARFSKWVADRGGGPFGREVSTERQEPPSEAELFDRWSTHTRKHPDTLAAYAFVKKAETLVQERCLPSLLALSALCLGLGAARLAAGPALLAAGALVAVGRLRRMQHGFVSGAPQAPLPPVAQLWDY